jgi:hypothetical protein
MGWTTILGEVSIFAYKALKSRPYAQIHASEFCVFVRLKLHGVSAQDEDARTCAIFPKSAGMWRAKSAISKKFRYVLNYRRNSCNRDNDMRAHRAVRTVGSADISIGNLRCWASRPRFLRLNAQRQGLAVGPALSKQTQRHFSRSTIVKAGAAQAV